MRVAISALVLAVMAAACGGKQSPAEATAAQAPDPAPADKTDAQSLSEADCEQLLEHVIELAVADQRERALAEHAAEEDARAENARANGLAPPAARSLDESSLWTEADVAKLRTSFLDEHMASCREMSRESLECGLRAQTITDLAQCNS